MTAIVHNAMHKNSGFVWLPILLVVLIISIIGGGAYLIAHRSSVPHITSSTVAENQSLTQTRSFVLSKDFKTLAVYAGNRPVSKISIADIPGFDAGYNGDMGSPTYAFDPYTTPVFNSKRNEVYFVVDDIGLSGANTSPYAIYGYSLAYGTSTLISTGMDSSTNLYLSPQGGYLVAYVEGEGGVCSNEGWLDVFNLSLQKLMTTIKQPVSNNVVSSVYVVFDRWVSDSAFVYTKYTETCATDGSTIITASSTEIFSVNPLSSNEALQKVANLPEIKRWLSLFSGPGSTSPSTNGAPVFDISTTTDGYLVHAYESMPTHTATFGWYDVNSQTGAVSNQTP